MKPLLGLLLALPLSLTACSDDAEPLASPTPTVTTVTARTTVTETVTASPPEPVSTGPWTPALEDPEPRVVTTEFPPDVDVAEHGGHYVAVALATEEPFLMVESDRRLRRLGYTVGVGELACLDGSAEALQLAPSTIASYLLFEDVVGAFRFVDAYRHAQHMKPVGVAKVTTYCLD